MTFHRIMRKYETYECPKIDPQEVLNLIKIDRMRHGGIMVNYACTAACRHCAYACSPTRSGGYMSEETAEQTAKLLVSAGCRSIHIGGGEPLIDFEGLLKMLHIFSGAGIRIEYLETNAFWANDADSEAKIKAIMKTGVDTLCISIDPYHAEYVPYERPLLLAEKCENTGMGYFLWKQQFLRMLSKLEADVPHTRMEMEATLSKNYIADVAGMYGIGYNGRAVNIETEYCEKYPLQQSPQPSRNRLLSEAILDNRPCRGLLAADHFHVDCEGYYIPQGCSGIRLPLEKIIGGISKNEYRIFQDLLHGGVALIYEIAKEHGFTPDESGYPSKCNLCFHIRRFLSGFDYPELHAEHYTESLKYY